MSTTLEQIQYGFDRDSRRTWQKRPLTSMQDQAYQYDALSQVSAAARGSLNLNMTAISGTPAAAQSWDYDPTGNWRGFHTTAAGTATLDQHRVNDRGNRLTQIEDNPSNMLLDRVGRMRQMAPDAGGDWDGTLELTWDAWSRITSVKNNGEVVGEYTYDGTHRRTTREVEGETLHSYYNSQWRPVEERKDAETTADISYLWGARHRDDLVRRDCAVGGTTLNETRYVLMDYFNPVAITDAAGDVKERYAFSAFGVRTILNPDFSVRSDGESEMEFGFQGQFLDTECGLMNYGYRYYSPHLGRWTCKDPIGEKGGINLYGMVDNYPINGIDRLGLVGGGGIGGPQWFSPGGIKAPQPGETRFPKLIKTARQLFIKDIDSWVSQNCGKTPYPPPSRRINVYANIDNLNPYPIRDNVDPDNPGQPLWDDQLGDAGQGKIESTTYGLGSFSLDIETPVSISYREYGSSNEYSWEALMYLEDSVGDKYLFGQVQKKISTWKIWSKGACCKNG